jgi:colanic acid biosynthesis glycosyl transferase WcaI
MKILVVSQYFWPEYFRINELCECLKSMGHYIEVLTGIPNYPQGKYYDGYSIFKNRKQIYKGIKVHRVPIIPRGQNGGDKRLIPNYISYVITASIAMLAKVFNRYDVILVYEVSPITQAYPALWMRWLTKTPVCLYVYDLWPETLFSHGIGKHGFLQKIMYFMVYSIYKRCDKIFVSSKGFEKSILLSGYDPKRLHYLPNWAEDFYKPINPEKCIRKELKLSQDSFIVMYAGNIGFAQSFNTVLEAAKQLKDEKLIHFVVLGEGSLKQWAIKEMNKFKLLNLSFFGRKPAEEMPSYFSQANAMLVTLKKRVNYSMTLPGRVQSYMACGKPIIACAGDEVSRVINESGAGLSCEPEDFKGLASIIKQMSQMPTAELESMGKRAILYSKNEFNKDKLLIRIEDLLSEMSKKRNRKKVF